MHHALAGRLRSSHSPLLQHQAASVLRNPLYLSSAALVLLNPLYISSAGSITPVLLSTLGHASKMHLQVDACWLTMATARRSYQHSTATLSTWPRTLTAPGHARLQCCTKQMRRIQHNHWQRMRHCHNSYLPIAHHP